MNLFFYFNSKFIFIILFCFFIIKLIKNHFSITFKINLNFYLNFY